MKDTFVFYTKYKDQFELMNNDEIAHIVMSMIEYTESGNVPKMTGREMLVFSMIKRDLDVDRKKYEERLEENRKNGSKGGRPKKNQTDNKKPYGFSENQTDNKKPDNEYDYDNDIKEILPSGSIKKSARFEPPSLADAKIYFGDKKFKSSAEEFYDHYQVNGWVQSNGNPVLDWQSQANKWERMQPQFEGRASPNKNKPGFAQREFDEKAEKERRMKAMFAAAKEIEEKALEESKRAAL